MAKSTNSTDAVDGQAMRLGTWHDDENKLFLEGLAKFGKDFKQLEKYIGTRTHAQVRTHYLQYAKKNGLASPEPTRKRKTDETPDGTETKKKQKSTPATSKAKETPKTSIAATPTKATPKLSARKEIPSKVGSPNKKMSPGKDIIPPSGKSRTKVARTSSKKLVAPTMLNPVVNESVAAVIEDDDIIANDVSKFVIFVRRDEVQTVIAGIVGFVLIYTIKKYIG